MSNIIKVKGVTLTKERRTILDDIDLEVPEGDYVGVIGPNGGGKTTLLKLILGLYEPDKGTIEVLGASPKKARGQVGYVPQYSKFDLAFPLQVLDVVIMGCLSRRGLFRRYNITDVEAAKAALEQVGLADYASRAIGGLSGGELQRVLIARALAQQPKLLLLDEPTASVDTPFGEALYLILSELNKKMAIVLVSHDISVVASQVKNVACVNQKIFYHHGRDIPEQTLEKVYGCHIDLIAHGHAHRVLGHHNH